MGAELVAITQAIIATAFGAAVVAAADGPTPLLLGFAAVLVGLGWWLVILARSVLLKAAARRDEGPRPAG